MLKFIQRLLSGQRTRAADITFAERYLGSHPSALRLACLTRVGLPYFSRDDYWYLQPVAGSACVWKKEWRRKRVDFQIDEEDPPTSAMACRMDIDVESFAKELISRINSCKSIANPSMPFKDGEVHLVMYCDRAQQLSIEVANPEPGSPITDLFRFFECFLASCGLHVSQSRERPCR